MNLFEVPVSDHVGKNCRDCRWVRQKPWQGRGGSGWYYCTRQGCNRSDCGWKRVKALRNACPMFEQKENESTKVGFGSGGKTMCYEHMKKDGECPICDAAGIWEERCHHFMHEAREAKSKLAECERQLAEGPVCGSCEHKRAREFLEQQLRDGELVPLDIIDSWYTHGLPFAGTKRQLMADLKEFAKQKAGEG